MTTHACGFQNDRAARYCGGCGKELPAPTNQLLNGLEALQGDATFRACYMSAVHAFHDYFRNVDSRRETAGQYLGKTVLDVFLRQLVAAGFRFAPPNYEEVPPVVMWQYKAGDPASHEAAKKAAEEMMAKQNVAIPRTVTREPVMSKEGEHLYDKVTVEADACPKCGSTRPVMHHNVTEPVRDSTGRVVDHRYVGVKRKCQECGHVTEYGQSPVMSAFRALWRKEQWLGKGKLDVEYEKDVAGDAPPASAPGAVEYQEIKPGKVTEDFIALNKHIEQTRRDLVAQGLLPGAPDPASAPTGTDTIKEARKSIWGDRDPEYMGLQLNITEKLPEPASAPTGSIAVARWHEGPVDVKKQLAEAARRINEATNSCVRASDIPQEVVDHLAFEPAQEIKPGEIVQEIKPGEMTKRFVSQTGTSAPIGTLGTAKDYVLNLPVPDQKLKGIMDRHVEKCAREAYKLITVTLQDFWTKTGGAPVMGDGRIVELDGAAWSVIDMDNVRNTVTLRRVALAHPGDRDQADAIAACAIAKQFVATDAAKSGGDYTSVVTIHNMPIVVSLASLAESANVKSSELAVGLPVTHDGKKYVVHRIDDLGGFADLLPCETTTERVATQVDAPEMDYAMKHHPPRAKVALNQSVGGGAVPWTELSGSLQNNCEFRRHISEYHLSHGDRRTPATVVSKILELNERMQKLSEWTFGFKLRHDGTWMVDAKRDLRWMHVIKQDLLGALNELVHSVECEVKRMHATKTLVVMDEVAGIPGAVFDDASAMLAQHDPEEDDDDDTDDTVDMPVIVQK